VRRAERIDKNLYLETQLSELAIIRKLMRLLDICGEDKSNLKIWYRLSLDHEERYHSSIPDIVLKDPDEFSTKTSSLEPNDDGMESMICSFELPKFPGYLPDDARPKSLVINDE
jgi:hypothetical protein